MENLIGKRIRLDSMIDEPNPIEIGSEGTVRHYGYGVINVQWNNGRTLGLIEGIDSFTIIN